MKVLNTIFKCVDRAGVKRGWEVIVCMRVVSGMWNRGELVRNLLEPVARRPLCSPHYNRFIEEMIIRFITEVDGEGLAVF